MFACVYPTHIYNTLCSPYIFLQHLMFARVHPNSFCNIPCLLVFVLPIFTTSHVCLCLPYLYLQHPVSPHVHCTNFYNIQCLSVFILINFIKSHVCPCSS